MFVQKYFKGLLRPLLLCLLVLFSLSSNAQDLTYKLGAGDLISISVYEEEELSFEVKIGDSGNITYPFLGEINIIGITAKVLENGITAGLIDGEFLIRPEVTVNVVEYRPFYIDGEVESPGSYPFEPGLTLRKAVTIAGGFTERASRTKISIISSNNESDEPENVDSLDVIVGPDDIITVEQRFF